MKHFWLWLAALSPLLILSLLFGSTALIWRRRRFRDWARLGRATRIPPEHEEGRPREVRDLAVGESGYVYSSNVVISKGKRVYVAWDAHLSDPPAQTPPSEFSPLQIERLKRGFRLAVRPGVEFRPSTLPWGFYAPVVELRQ